MDGEHGVARINILIVAAWVSFNTGMTRTARVTTWSVLLALSYTPVALAAQWTVTLTRIEVSKTKPGGAPWDGDNSPPDMSGRFVVGKQTTSGCKVTTSRTIEKVQDVFVSEPGLTVIAEGDQVGDLCLGVELVDKDVLEDDTIGRGSIRLGEGEGTFTIGNARISATAVPVPQQLRSSELRPPAHRDALYCVTLVSGRIAPRRADGASWDEASDPDAENREAVGQLFRIGLAVASGGLLSGLASAAAGSQGGPPSAAAQRASAPDPRVVLSWNSLQFSTPTQRDTFAPKWDTRVVIPAGLIESVPMQVDVLDSDDGEDETIGTDLVPITDLTKDPIYRFSSGAVESLVFRVERCGEAAAPLERDIRVDTTGGWTDTGLNVMGGQHVSIEAVGKHCVASGACVGPEGGPKIVLRQTRVKRGRARQEEIHEGELCAVVGDHVYPVGSGRMFLAHNSGPLLLGAANTKTSSGSLTARVRLFYPLERQKWAGGPALSHRRPDAGTAEPSAGAPVPAAAPIPAPAPAPESVTSPSPR